MLSGILSLALGIFSGSGLVPTFTKIGIHFSSPLLFVFFRFLFATILFSPFVLFTKRTPLKKRDYQHLALLAFFLAINVSLFTIGVRLTTVLMSQLLYLPTPIIVSIFAHFYLRETLSGHKIVGMCLTLCGALFLIYQSVGSKQITTFGTPVGNLLIIIAMLGFAAWILYTRSLAMRKTYSSYQTTFFTFLFICVYLLFVIPIQSMLVPSPVTNIVPEGFFFALAVGCVTVVQYFFMQLGIKKTNAFTTSLFQYVGPVFAGLTAIPILHEKVSGLFIIGGLFIFAGVFYATTYQFLQKKLQKQEMM